MYVKPSSNLSANRARHRMVLLFWIRRRVCRHFHRWISHVTIRSWRFESLGESVGISIGESITSPYEADVLNPSVIPSVKNNPSNLHVSEPPFFFLILNISSVISSVYTDRCWSSVVTDEITDGVKSVGNGDPKLPTELFHRQFRWY